jgi:large subunit ribosomal protein L7/L12
MAFITENPTLAIGVWSLVLLLIGFLAGYSRGKARLPETTLDRGRLDQPPPMSAAPPSATPAQAFRSTGPSNLSPEALTRIHDALRAGNKIQAIKIMREETGLGLAEAKNAVEAM